MFIALVAMVKFWLFCFVVIECIIGHNRRRLPKPVMGPIDWWLIGPAIVFDLFLIYLFYRLVVWLAH